MATWYRTGTVSVSNGSAALTGTTTGFTDATVKTGDALFIPSSYAFPEEILTVNSPTSITLARAWPGTTVSGAAYFIFKGMSWGDVTRLAVQITELIANQVDILSGVGAPSNAYGTDSSVYFQQDIPQYYAKAAGAWNSPISLVGPTGSTGPTGPMGATGPANSLTPGTITTGAPGSAVGVTITGTAPSQIINITIPRGDVGATGATGAMGSTGAAGPTGASYYATSASSNTVAAGSKVFVTQTGLAYAVGASRVRWSDASGANYVEGLVTAYAAGSMTVAVDRAIGTGTITSWFASLAGDVGATGPTSTVPGPAGPTYSTTSTTSLTVGTGSNVFTLAGSAMPYQAGDRLRASSASDLTKVMSGLVTAYSHPTLTLNIDLIGSGSGTATDWNISLTGEKGDQGAAGGLSGLSATKGNIPVADGTTYGVVSVGLDGQVPIADATQTRGIKWDAIDVGVCQGRLTLTTGVPVLTSNVTGATTLRFTPYLGATIALYNGTSWRSARFTETSLALTGLTASSNYDIFAYDNSGTLALEALIWTNATTRATALALQDGVYVKSGATTRRYVGTIRIDATTGQCSWVYGGSSAGGTEARLGVWNMQNRVDVATLVQNSTASWNYALTTPRQPNGSGTMRVSFVSGLQEDIYVSSYGALANGTGAAGINLVMLDSTSAASGVPGYCANGGTAAHGIGRHQDTALGFHFISAGEACNTASTITFYGSGTGSIFANGLQFKFRM